MKKNFDLQEVIKEAVKEGVIEAFMLLYGVSTVDGSTPEGGNSEEDDDKKDPVRPQPTWGPAGFSLRKS